MTASKPPSVATWSAWFVRSLRPPAGLPSSLAIQTVVFAIGSGMFTVGSAVFFTRYAGLPAARVGIGLSIAGALGLIANVPLGILADRIGGRRSWMLGALAQAVVFLAYPFVRSFATFLTVATVEVLAAAFSTIGRAKYLGDLLPPEVRVRSGAYLLSALNVGMMIGTLLAGVALSVDRPAGYMLMVLCTAATHLINFLFILLTAPQVSTGETTSAASKRVAVLRDRTFLAVALIAGVMALNGPLLSVALPLWIVERTDAPRSLIAAIFMLNMLLVAVGQVWASRGADDVGGAARVQTRAGMFLVLACATFAVTQYTTAAMTLVVLVIGAIVLTLGELYASASSWGLSYGLAPAEARGQYLATFALGRQLAWVVAPGAMTVLVIETSSIGWLILAVPFIIASLLSAPTATRALTKFQSTLGARS